MDTNKALEFIGSKWFMVGLGLLMMGLLPTTYNNLILVFNAGELARVWWVPTVFIANLLSAIMSIYKAAGMFFEKKNENQVEWD